MLKFILVFMSLGTDNERAPFSVFEFDKVRKIRRLLDRIALRIADCSEILM